MERIETISKVLEERKFELLSKPNVVAVGIGHKRYNGKKRDMLCIVCSVTKKLPAKSLSRKDLIPSVIDMELTDVQESGELKTLRKDKLRPPEGGVSAGHVYVTAGTLGGVAKLGDLQVYVSNNHVFANSNRAEKGDTIIQPGSADDGNSLRDKIAELEKFEKIHFEEQESACGTAKGVTKLLNRIAKGLGSKAQFKTVSKGNKTNLVDAAIAAPYGVEVVNCIKGIGPTKGSEEANIDDEVVKSGRTTGITAGKIEQVKATVKVDFGGGKKAIFEDQLISDIQSGPGDSGSLVLTRWKNYVWQGDEVVEDRPRVVGLLFAGSPNRTIINRASNVEKALNIKF